LTLKAIFANAILNMLLDPNENASLVAKRVALESGDLKSLAK
jgi:hypothetical protein